MWTRVFLTVLLSCLLLGCFAAQTTAAPERTISIDIKDRTLREAVQQVADATGIRYRFEPGVPNVRLTMNIRDVEIEALLGLMLRQAGAGMKGQGLTWRLEGNIYVIKVGPAPMDEAPVLPRVPDLPRELVENPKLDNKLTFAAKGERLERVVDRIFAGTGVQLKVQAELSKLPVTLSVREVSALAVARILFRQVAAKQPGANLWREGKVYVLGVGQRKDRLPDQP